MSSSDQTKALKLGTKAVLLLTSAIVGFSVISGSFYTVAPNEVAYVTRFGQVSSDKPERNGLHFKIPFIDRVDSAYTSLNQLAISPVNVNTLDNQSVNIGINISYRIPESAVYHLLFEVGRVGNLDIETALSRVVYDRSLRIFSQHNTIKLSEERGAIVEAMKISVAEQLQKMFGVEVEDLQITHLEYSKVFQDSDEAAVKAKNLAIQAENETRKVEAEAKQTKIKAEAASYAKKQDVDAEAYSIHENAKAEAFAIKEKGDALAKNPNIVKQTLAEKWDGKLPETMVPGSALPFIDVKAK
jgi:modulator of FtsH protease HflC